LKQFLSGISASFFTALSAVLVALVSVFNAIDGWLSRRILKRGMRNVDTKVDKVVEHTDGMLKTMIDSAKAAGEVKGHKAGTEQATHIADVKADALAQGQAEGRAEKNGQPK
jgi:hypothetical protein